MDNVCFHISFTMFGSFFKVAVRILMRDRVHTLINIFGLAIGLAFSIIIFLYVNQETNYDRFHTNADRIYRVGVKGRISDNVFNHALSPAPLAKTLVQEVPGVENAVRIARFGAWLVQYGNIRNNEDNLIFADSAFFSVFSFPLVRGNLHEVLRAPRSIVLSESKAWYYFGAEDPIGKRLRIENDSTYYTVTGIMKDVPRASHMHFDMVGTLSTFDTKLHDDRWVVNYLYTYLLARPAESFASLDSAVQQLVPKYVYPDYVNYLGIPADSLNQSSGYFSFTLQPVRSIHLHSELNAEFEPVGNIMYVYLFTALGIVILVLSCINFIALTTARSQERAQEVCIRKIAGSERHILVRQFLIESSVLAFLSMALALFITELCIPPFNAYMNLDLRLSQLLNSSGILLVMVLILVIGLVSGLYPALHFSSADPVSLNHISSRSRHHKNSRVALVLFQLFISVGVITLAGIVKGQYRYLTSRDLGFDKENLLVIRRPDGLRNQLEAYKAQIRNHPGVLAVTNSTSIPGSGFSRLPYYLEGTASVKNYAAASVLVSYDFDSTYRISLKEGRFFDSSIPADTAACVINETMAKLLGGGGLLGKNILQPTDKPGLKHRLTVIGVVADFNFETLDHGVFPMVMQLMPGNFEGYLTVRLKEGRADEAIAYLKSTWEQYTRAYPFVSYFLADNLRERYDQVRETGRIFTLLSVVSLLIACLGLFGLVSYHFNLRGAEIGIRKALGALPGNIILGEFRRIFWFLLTASVLAWLGAYFLARYWLMDYAYRIPLQPLHFIVPFGLILLVSFSAVMYRSWLAARANPGKALRVP
jgi:putative ABC transport system permease protein